MIGRIALAVAVALMGTAGANELAGDCRAWNKTVLSPATPDDVIRCLEKDPAIALESDITGRTLLHQVALIHFQEAPDARATRAILEAGADPNARWKYGETPLHEAIGVRWPLLWRNPSRLRKPETTVAMVRAMLEHGANPNQRVLTTKQQFGQPKSVIVAMKDRSTDGEKVVVREEFTPLMEAIRQGESPDIVHVLLEHGADPNLGSRHENWTSLHMAAYKGNPDVIRLLLDHGANPHANTSERKWTPLHALAWSGGLNPANTMASVKLLLEAGVDPSVRDSRGRTMWEITLKRHGARLKKMLDAGQVSDESRTILARLEKAGS